MSGYIKWTAKFLCPVYFDVIIRRLDEFTGKKEELIDG